MAVKVVVLFAMLDLVWNDRAALVFTGWRIEIVAVCGLIILSFVYTVARPNRALAELPAYAALWIIFSITGAVATYLASAADRPLQDEAFAAFDRMTGFDWVTWADFVRAHPLLHVVLGLSYRSLALQIAGSLCLFAFIGVKGRNDDLLATAGVALLLTVIFSAIWPALGPWVHYGYRTTDPDNTVYVADVLMLRQGSTVSFALADMQGIVCFPSYHTVLALMFVYAHRGLRWSLPPVMILNGLMLLSIPSEGGHYLADMVSGALVAVAAIALTRMLHAAPGSENRQPRASLGLRVRAEGARSASLTPVRRFLDRGW